MKQIKGFTIVGVQITREVQVAAGQKPLIKDSKGVIGVNFNYQRRKAKSLGIAREMAHTIPVEESWYTYEDPKGVVVTHKKTGERYLRCLPLGRNSWKTEFRDAETGEVLPKDEAYARMRPSDRGSKEPIDSMTIKLSNLIKLWGAKADTVLEVVG